MNFREENDHDDTERSVSAASMVSDAASSPAELEPCPANRARQRPKEKAYMAKTKSDHEESGHDDEGMLFQLVSH